MICDNVPENSLQPDYSQMTLPWSNVHDGQYATLTDESGQGQWRVKTTVLTLDSGELVTLVVGVDLTDVDSTITRYSLIFFLFADRRRAARRGRHPAARDEHLRSAARRGAHRRPIRGG